MTRVATAVALALILVAAVSVPVGADGTGDAWTDGSHIGVGAGDGDSTGGSGSAQGGGQPTCEWVKLETDASAIADWMAGNGTGAAKGAEPGAWYRKICWGADGSSTAAVLWVTDRVDPAVLARQAADNVPIPAPGLFANPDPSDGAVVNVETWLWVDPESWRPVSAQAAAGGVVVTATAAPKKVVWDMGNGDRVTCTGPGTPYERSRSAKQQSTDCSYTYRQSSARAESGTFTLTATVVWQVTWSVTGAAGGGSLGAAPRSQSVRIPVKEIQAVNR